MKDTKTLRERLKELSIVAVLVIDDPEDAIPLARALLRGGVRAMELTLRTPAAFDALLRITREVPEMFAGVGTIIQTEQVTRAKASGAAFGVSPGMNPVIVDAAKAADLPFAPGIATPSEIEAAYERGCTLMKVFPAEGLGGVSYMKAIGAPYSHLGIGYIPLGGITVKNLGAYLERPEVIAIGGSWLATRELIGAKNWDAISKNCEEAVELTARIRG